MRAVIQRVARAQVEVGGDRVSETGPGMLVLLGVATDDSQEDVAWLAGKIARLRIFADETASMNRSVVETGGEVMVVSQFTLLAATKKGNRPSFVGAARPEEAVSLYEEFVEVLGREIGGEVKTGRFGEDMKVSLVGDGPVTIVIDSKLRE